MAAQILRRQKAAEDVEQIANYLANDSVDAAIRFLENAESTLNYLAAFPGAGSRFNSTHPRLGNLRFRRVTGFPRHVVFYFDHKDAIEVVRILHGAQDLDCELLRQ